MKLPKIYQINTEPELNNFLVKLQKAKVIAIDTEFTRYNTYYPLLNLLQVSLNYNEAILFDFMTTPELVKKVVQAIYNCSATKVFHSAKNDIEVLYNLINLVPTQVFDTQIAFMALSPIENISYSNLIKEVLGVNLTKNQTLSNWSKRPLSSKQIEYAANDVIYLYEAYFKVQKLLKKKKRQSWIIDKLNEVYNIDNYEFNLQKYLHKYVNQHGINYNLNIIANVLNCREKLAKKHNLPRQYILKDEVIKSIGTALNKNQIASLKLTKFITHKNLLEIIESKEDPTDYNQLIIQPQKLEKHKFLDIGLELLDFISKKTSLNKSLIINKSDLNQYLHNKINYPELETSWKYQAFGKHLIRLLNGRLSLKIKNNQIYFK